MSAYAIVVATRNRLQALLTSIPLFLAQSRPPARLIIVDASDDHNAVRIACMAAAGAGPMEVVRSGKANLAHQRNLGLDRVEEPVVALPDDDSLWRPDTAERLLALYAADREGLIGGVTATETRRSPLPSSVPAPRKAEPFGRSGALAQARNLAENILVPQPFHIYARARIAELAPGARRAGLDHKLVETMGGFRMSFRTEVARRLRFDEKLGSRIGYAQHEDKDLSLRVLRDGRLLAAAKDAYVFHNTSPGRRAGGFAYGFCQIFHYAYICRKVCAEGDPALDALPRYLRYKVLLYRLARRDEYSVEVHEGGARALSELPALLAAPRSRLARLYAEAMDRHLPPASAAGERPRLFSP